MAVGLLDIVVKGNATPFTNELDRASKKAEKAGQDIRAAFYAAGSEGGKTFAGLANNIGQLNNPLSIVTGAIDSFAAKLGLAGAVASIGVMAHQAIELGSSMYDMAIKTGVSVEQLSRFSTVAKLSNTSMESVGATMNKLMISQAEAVGGNKKMQTSFEGLGISMKDLKTLQPDELMVKLSETIRGIDPKNLNDLFRSVGGRGATEVLPFFRELNERLDETKVKISSDFAKSAKDFDDNLYLMSNRVSALTRQLLQDLLPAINAIMQAMLAGEGASYGFMAQLKSGFSLNGDVDALKKRLESEKESLAKIKQQRDEADDPGVWADDVKKAELRVKMYNDRIAQLGTSIVDPLDTSKNTAAADAIRKNATAAGQNAGEDFLKGLRLRLTKGASGEYAQLLAQAGEKGVGSQAKGLIDQIRAQDELNTVKTYTQNLQLQTEEYQKQLVQIGMTKNEIELMNVDSKLTLDLQKQIEQIERSKGTLTDETKQKMLEQKDAAVQTIQEIIKAKQAAEQTFGGGLNKGLTEVLENAENVGKQVSSSVVNAFGNMENALVSFATTGKMNFANLANSIISDIMRIYIRAMIIGPIVRALTGGGGATNPFPNGPVITALEEARGDAFFGGRVMAFAGGGVVDSPHVFPMAGGAGLMGEAGPEGILPLGRDSQGRLGVRSSGGGGVNINVYNEAGGDGYQASATAKQNTSGGFDVEVLVRKALGNDLSRNGPMSQQISSTFGLRRNS